MPKPRGTRSGCRVTRGPSLEVMSGSGRLMIPLMQLGLNVHGADASPAMLASCEARLGAAALTTPLFRQDAVTLNLPFRYAAAFVAAGSFQLLVDPIAAQKALERIRAHLVAPGVLLMDLYVPAEAAHPPGAPVVHVQTVTLPDGTKIARRSETASTPRAGVSTSGAATSSASARRSSPARTRRSR